MKKTIIVVFGGVVQDVVTNDPNMEFIIVDWDNIKSGDDMGEYPHTLKSDEEFDQYVKDTEDDKLRNIETSVASEIKEELARLGRIFTDEDDDPLTFFSFKDVSELSVEVIKADGTFVLGFPSFQKEEITITSLIDNGDLNIFDVVSLLDELREIKR